MKEKKRPVYDQDRFKNKQTNKTNPKQKQNKKAWTPESCNKGMWCHYYAVWGIFLFLNLVVKQDRWENGSNGHSLADLSAACLSVSQFITTNKLTLKE